MALTALIAAVQEQIANSSWAGIIAAIAGVFTSIAVLIGSLTLLIPLLRNARQVNAKVDEVHHIVNQQRTDLLRYQQALIKTLAAAGIQAPDDQSVMEAPPSHEVGP